MSEKEAASAGIDKPTSYFNVASGKANLAPRGEKATWRHIVGVPLWNGTSPDDLRGDVVGVVEAWQWPSPFAEVSVADAKEVQARISQGEWRADYRSDKWAGKAVAEVLGWDLSETAARASVKALLKTWIRTGALREVKRNDDQRKPRRFVEIGEPQP